MKNKNTKYYNPDISEFCVGFEYEYKPRIREGIISFINDKFKYIDMWEKDIIKDPYKQENINNFLDIIKTNGTAPYNISDTMRFHKDDAIRVKYLDSDDIKSLGFELEEESDPYGNMIFLKTIYSLGIVPENHSGNHIRIMWSPVNKGIWLKRSSFGSWGNEEDTLPFDIKNKSELKRLLKQLGIDD